MRKTRLGWGLAGVAASLGLAISLTGCAPATPPLSLAKGIGFCIPDSSAHAEGFAIDARNSAGDPITILGATVGGANMHPGRTWLFPVNRGTVGVSQVQAPFTGSSDWATRIGLPAKIRPRTNVQVFVTMTFPKGITSSELEGVTVRYRAADGLTHTAKTNVEAKFRNHCH